MDDAATIVAIRRDDPTREVSEQSPHVFLNGRKLVQPFTFRTRQQIGVPTTGVWLNGQRIFDVEVWVDGNLVAKVGARTDELDRWYDVLERVEP